MTTLSKSQRYLSKKYLHQSIIVLVICSLFLFYKYIAQLFPSVISEELIKHDGLTGLQLAIMASSYYYSYSLLQIVAGFIIDKKDVRIPCFLAILVISVAILVFTGADNFYIMCISRTLMGAGTAFATVMYMKCAASWTSPRLFGIISSLLATFTMFGAAFGSAPIAYLFSKVGWKNGLDLIAYIGIAISILALCFVTNKGSKANTQTYEVKFADFKKVITHKTNWMLFLYSGLTFAPIIIIGGLWGNPFLITKFNVSNTDASLLLFMMFIGVGIGAPFWAILAAKINSRSTLMHIANLLAFMAMLAIIYLPMQYKSALIVFFIIGFAVGCFMLCFQICREINAIYTMGFAVAFINMSDGIVSSIIEPIIGKTLDILKVGTSFSLNDFHIALSLIPLCFILSSVVLAFIKTKPAETKRIH